MWRIGTLGIQLILKITREFPKIQGKLKRNETIILKTQECSTLIKISKTERLSLTNNIELSLYTSDGKLSQLINGEKGLEK